MTARSCSAIPARMAKTVRPIGVAVSIDSVTERPACRRYASKRWTISPRGGGCGWPGPGLGRWMRRERVPEANEPRCEPGKSHVQLISSAAPIVYASNAG
jgi:hypothetical protein